MSTTELTTRFAPAPSCVSTDNLWQVWSHWPTATTSGEPTGWWWQVGPPINTDCFPPSYTDATTAFYSPAQCSFDYTPINNITNTYAGSLTETAQT
ncbi:hypothetical protein BDV96DRAFT_340594 [Lophiotrema nucula]|uniref:Uncharacterized protein n=1 Tax=Lophiotrema nucula TaxID=690887 RepID=A0A6A5YG23_9PLEO|nr:hypothetical protein BDV96DRAFT_340594 [Lophiotrema nucula]